MKIINRLTNSWFAILCIMFCTAAVYSSCGGDDDEIIPDGGEVAPDKDVPDPAGTITLSMRDYKNGDTRLDNIYIENENFTGSGFLFASIGSVKGLGNVTNIPTTGWASKVAVIPGNGYVAYDNSYWGTKKFYRIYVTDYIVSTTGGIIGAEVKYQEPFKGKDEAISLDVQSLTIPAEGGGQTLTFKNQGVILFDVKSDKFTVEKTSTYDYSFLTNGIAITAEPNSSSSAIEGTITLTTLYGKETVIKVTQAGAEPFVSFSESELELSATQQTQTVGMSGNIAFSDLSANSSASWCKAELIDNTSSMQAQSKRVKFIGDQPVNTTRAAQSDAATSYSLKLSLDENTTINPRNATITVKSKDGKTSATLKVVQKGITFEVKSDKVGFDKNANYRTITINTTVKEWEAESSADWCTFSKNGNQITIRATASTEDRTAVVSFKGFDTKITVHQSKYAVGDSFNEDGIEGTVGYIGDEARYIYKNIGQAAWSTEEVETGANNMDDGEYNMSVIKKIPSWEDSYPAFLLCEQLNTNGVKGWYLPARNEVDLRLDLKQYYCTSTERSYRYAYNSLKDNFYAWSKSRAQIVIAVHKF